METQEEKQQNNHSESNSNHPTKFNEEDEERQSDSDGDGQQAQELNDFRRAMAEMESISWDSLIQVKPIMLPFAEEDDYGIDILSPSSSYSLLSTPANNNNNITLDMDTIDIDTANNNNTLDVDTIDTVVEVEADKNNEADMYAFEIGDYVGAYSAYHNGTVHTLPELSECSINTDCGDLEKEDEEALKELEKRVDLLFVSPKQDTLTLMEADVGLMAEVEKVRHPFASELKGAYFRHPLSSLKSSSALQQKKSRKVLRFRSQIDIIPPSSKYTFQLQEVQEAVENATGCWKAVFKGEGLPLRNRLTWEDKEEEDGKVMDELDERCLETYLDQDLFPSAAQLSLQIQDLVIPMDLSRAEAEVVSRELLCQVFNDAMDVIQEVTANISSIVCTANFLIKNKMETQEEKQHNNHSESNSNQPTKLNEEYEEWQSNAVQDQQEQELNDFRRALELTKMDSITLDSLIQVKPIMLPFAEDDYGIAILSPPSYFLLPTTANDNNNNTLDIDTIDIGTANNTLDIDTIDTVEVEGDMSNEAEMYAFEIGAYVGAYSSYNNGTVQALPELSECSINTDCDCEDLEKEDEETRVDLLFVSPTQDTLITAKVAEFQVRHPFASELKGAYFRHPLSSLKSSSALQQKKSRKVLRFRSQIEIIPPSSKYTFQLQEVQEAAESENVCYKAVVKGEGLPLRNRNTWDDNEEEEEEEEDGKVMDELDERSLEEYLDEDLFPSAAQLSFTESKWKMEPEFESKLELEPESKPKCKPESKSRLLEYNSSGWPQFRFRYDYNFYNNYCLTHVGLGLGRTSPTNSARASAVPSGNRIKMQVQTAASELRKLIGWAGDEAGRKKVDVDAAEDAVEWKQTGLFDLSGVDFEGVGLRLIPERSPSLVPFPRTPPKVCCTIIEGGDSDVEEVVPIPKHIFVDIDSIPTLQDSGEGPDSSSEEEEVKQDYQDGEECLNIADAIKTCNSPPNSAPPPPQRRSFFSRIFGRK